MSDPRTPQVPMVDQNGQPFYPLTQYNQIVMPGGERWDGNPGSSVELDATLKVAGKAADAAAVGAAVNELKTEKVGYDDALTLEEIEASTDLTGKVAAASAVVIKKTFKTMSVDVTANVSSETRFPYSEWGIDTAKILFTDVFWSNPLDDVPLAMNRYAQPSHPYIFAVMHKWNVSQKVNFNVLIVYR